MLQRKIWQMQGLQVIQRLHPSARPTKCNLRTWFYNTKTKQFNNAADMRGNTDKEYGSMKECCEDNFGPIPYGSTAIIGSSGCPHEAIYDACCEMGNYSDCI